MGRVLGAVGAPAYLALPFLFIAYFAIILTVPRHQGSSGAGTQYCRLSLSMHTATK